MARSFGEQIANYAEKYSERIHQVTADFAEGLSRQIITRTPVGNPDVWQNPDSAPPGYVGGTARANWIPSIGAPVTSAIDSIADPTPKVTAIKQRIPGTIYYLTNNVPYIERLEYEAWSRQAPRGMMRVSIREATKYLNDAVRENTRR